MSPSEPSEQSRSVAVVGLGNLGLPISEALLAASWKVAVFDTRADSVAAAARSGARPVTTAAELADCATVAVVVSDDAAVRDVLETSGLLAGLAPGSIVAVHSTILPDTARDLAERAATYGIGLIDAQVSGGPDRARAGTLTVMAGGDADVMARADDYLRTIANNVVHAGPAGAGAATKLGNQLMMFAALASTYEAVELAGAYGVAPETLFAATESSTGDCWIARNWGFFDRIAADYDASGVPLRNRTWSKDLWDVIAAARGAGVQLPVAGLLAQLMPERVERHAAAARSGGS